MALIVEAAISVLTHLLVGVLFSAIMFMIWRDDLAAGLIKKYMCLNQKISQFDQNWTDVYKELAVDGVPPAVWIQAMLNRLQAFECSSLAPLNKCLEMTSTRLANTIKMIRWAVVRQKHERSLLLLGITPRVSTSTNTDDIVEPLAESTILVDSLSTTNSGTKAESVSDLTARAVSDLTTVAASDLTTVAASDLTTVAASDLTTVAASDLSTVAASYTTTAKSISNIPTATSRSNITTSKSVSNRTTAKSESNKTTAKSISNISTGRSGSTRTTTKSISIVDPASIVRIAETPSSDISVKLIAEAVVDKILWMRNTIPTYWNRVVRICKAFNSALHSEQLKHILEYGLRLAKKTVKLSTDINMMTDLTKVSLQFAPDVVEEPVKTKRFNFF